MFDPKNPQFPTFSSFLPLPPDLKPTTQYSWNAGFQRQVSQRVFASATYVGTKIDHIVGAEEQNPALYIAGNCVAGQYGLTAAGPCSTAANINFRRALNLNITDNISSGYNPNGANLSYVTQYTDTSYQNYNGLLLNTRIDVARNLNFNMNYTLSKCTGVAAAGLLNTGASHLHQPFQNAGPQDITLDEGPCGADRRHVVNLTAVVRTPTFSNQVVDALAGHWTVSSVIHGAEWKPGDRRRGLGCRPQRLHQQRTDTGREHRPGCRPVWHVQRWGQRDPARLPQRGRVRPTRDRHVWQFPARRGPRTELLEWDQSFSRSFGLPSGHRLELRAEAINLTNHLNWGNPGITLSSAATFGRETPTGTPRIIQLAAKYVF